MMFKTQRTQRSAAFSLSPQRGHAFSGVRPSSGAETGEPPAGQRISSALRDAEACNFDGSAGLETCRYDFVQRVPGRRAAAVRS